MPQQYQDHRKCDKCGEQRHCLYFATLEGEGYIQGQWLCASCQNDGGEAIADMAKAAGSAEFVRHLEVGAHTRSLEESKLLERVDKILDGKDDE